MPPIGGGTDPLTGAPAGVMRPTPPAYLPHRIRLRRRHGRRARGAAPGRVAPSGVRTPRRRLCRTRRARRRRLSALTAKVSKASRSPIHRRSIESSADNAFETPLIRP